MQNIINVIFPIIPQEEMVNFVQQVVEQADEECKQFAIEDPLQKQAKQVYLKLQEDAFDYNLEFELSAFIAANLGMPIFELNRQFRNKYDI